MARENRTKRRGQFSLRENCRSALGFALRLRRNRAREASETLFVAIFPRFSWLPREKERENFGEEKRKKRYRGGGAEGGKKIHPPGNVPEGDQERKELSQYHIEGIAGGVRDAQRIHRSDKLAGIFKSHGGGEGEEVDNETRAEGEEKK